LRPRASAELTFTPLDRAGALADGAAQDPQQRAEAKALIESQTERLGNLLGDLRELTRLDLAEGVRPRELALAPFVKGLVDGFRREAAGAGIDLTVTAHGDDAFTDGRLLEMIGSNPECERYGGGNRSRAPAAGLRAPLSSRQHARKGQRVPRDPDGANRVAR
jgi:hypothetical protein